MKILNFVYLGYADAPNGAATFFERLLKTGISSIVKDVLRDFIART